MSTTIITQILTIIALFTLTTQDLLITQSKCQIYYSIANQTTYSFQSCMDNLNTIYNAWSNCQIACCPQANHSFSQSSLDECGSITYETPSSLTLIIVLCIIAGIVIILAFICSRCRAYRARLQLKKMEEALPSHEKGHLTISAEEEKWIERGNGLDMGDEIINPIKQQVNCSICLDTSTTIALLCSHEFHQQCSDSWFKKKLSCPMCRAQVHFIKIKCVKMCNRYMLLRWQDYEAINGKFNKVCDKCLNDQKEDVKKVAVRTRPE